MFGIANTVAYFGLMVFGLMVFGTPLGGHPQRPGAKP